MSAEMHDADRERSERRARRAAALANDRAPSDFLAAGPVGHARGLMVSERITSDYRHTWRNGSLDVKPSEVTETLREAGIQKW
ncbi:MAG: hypothetical protein AAF664_22360, partial [Planctomycetota bacterium]